MKNYMNLKLTYKKTRLLSILIIVTGVVYTKVVHSEIRDQTTSRLVSTAGTGVGSILLEESAVLNPASVAFFNNSSLYYQQTKVSNSADRSQLSDAMSVIATDGKGGLKGSFGYHKNEVGLDKRQKFSLTAASAGGKSSSVGINISQFKDTIFEEGQVVENEYRTMSLGVTHIVSPSMSFGVIIEDPTKASNVDPDLAIVGFHYQIHQYISLMADAATVYRGNNINEKYLYRGAIQLTFLSDFFLRAGVSRDRTRDYEERTSGLGLSWVQPKLTFDLAFQDIEKLYPINSDNEDFLNQPDTLREASFSISYRF